MGCTSNYNTLGKKKLQQQLTLLGQLLIDVVVRWLPINTPRYGKMSASAISDSLLSSSTMKSYSDLTNCEKKECTCVL